MKKILLITILFMIFLIGCERSIEKIYIQYCDYGMFGGKSCGWAIADVIKKDGDMWTIVAKGNRFIIDITATDWKPMK